ncbi:MAG: YraN family protein [Proteobacteria bacterium]|nr:YraN family protein [Pseudomonadota bacterium]
MTCKDDKIRKAKPVNQSGKIAEDIAANYLTRQGLKLIVRNFHCRFGEIDLIGLDREVLVFTEVRYRQNEYHMAVVETIDRHKQRKLVKTSEYYLIKNKTYQSYYCRYDVIAITGGLDKPTIEWIKNAFQA